MDSMLQPSTIQLLRLPFSFFLLPVSLFALSQPLETNWLKAGLLLIILHLLVFPASNGYNSYMDRDEGPVGGIEKPLQPTRQLLIIVFAMDTLALLLSLFVSGWVFAVLLVYILASRAYSSRNVRLKRYPILGFLVVILCQGALVFWMVYHGSHASQSLNVPFTACLASTLLMGGAYPLTQVYQHDADGLDGVYTISMLAGIKGTFILSGLLFTLAFLVLGLHFALQLEADRFLVLLVCFLPVQINFFSWAKKVWRNQNEANYENLMKMNRVAAFGGNSGFLIILIWKIIG
ncbi:hypothetical protein HY58_02930 [Flavihumibacter sp. ZG627]|nr:hypothetical protein HY58_02930 [Flavihumibacter sp. ZG627]